jgi:hypothetical protein
MYGEDKFRKFVEKHPHHHKTFFNRPHFTRRQFFEVVGAGVTGSYLVGQAPAAQIVQTLPVTPKGTAKNVIFILLAGAPSHTDTFDFKMVNGVTPAATKPDTFNGVVWPTGIFPKLKDNLPDFALVRSMRAWALVHGLAQTWTQIGRNPAAALGDIAPNIGSIVAIEKAPDRRAADVFPAFVSLNSNNPAGAGYLSSQFSPLRIASPLGKPVEDMDDFYKAAKGLMYNNAVKQAFSFTTADSVRYGNNSFGNSCAMAKQILQADMGTRFVQITVGGWDMHQNIYGVNGNPAQGTNIFTLGKILDDAVSALINDLKANGMFDSTLVVMAGEFGRTVGKLTGAQGRDHFMQQSAFFAGAGIQGGRAIGSTNSDGSATDDPGWSRARDVKPEDIEATIYSAMGINWTTIRYDDPFGRGFEYVPHAASDLYGPIDELWG